jgi:hypothetical protein
MSSTGLCGFPIEKMKERKNRLNKLKLHWNIYIQWTCMPSLLPIGCGFREEYTNVPDYGRRTASDDNTSYDTLGQVR